MVDRKRHFMKAITWRIIATLTTFTLVYLYTGHLETGITVGVFDFAFKILLYYFHERAWYKMVRWGVKEGED